MPRALALRLTDFKLRKLVRQPLALTLPLTQWGFGTHPWQLETKLPQSQTGAKGIDGRAIGDRFAAMHGSGNGPSTTSEIDALESAFEGQTGKHLLSLSFTGFDPHRS